MNPFSKNPKNLMLGALVMALASSLTGCAATLNDITTDTVNPPAFRANLPLRKNASVPATYPGEKAAAKQAKAYPDIRPLYAVEPTTVVFQKALAAAEESGWEIIEAAPREGRLEAVDTTAILRFKDDIVVRVMPEGTGSRVDVRSVSRIGKGDLGKNAKRIRGYFDKLRKTVTVAPR